MYSLVYILSKKAMKEVIDLNFPPLLSLPNARLLYPMILLIDLPSSVIECKKVARHNCTGKYTKNFLKSREKNQISYVKSRLRPAAEILSRSRNRAVCTATIDIRVKDFIIDVWISQLRPQPHGGV